MFAAFLKEFIVPEK